MNNKTSDKTSVQCISMPKFTANKIDKILALTLNVKNVICSSIETHIENNKVSLKFSTEHQNSQTRFYGLLIIFPNTSVLSISNDIWDNNIIFQVELENEVFNFKYSSSGGEVDLSRLREYNLVDTVQQIEKSSDDQDLFSVQIEAIEEKKDRSISIEIKTNSNDEDDENKAEESKTCKKINRKKLKNRSMSESFCDNLKVISEKTEKPSEVILDLDSDLKARTRKFRSISYSESENTLEGITRRLKSILKRSSLTRSISECSSDLQEPFSCSMDDGSFMSLIDHNCLSESCKKSVRFDDTIKKQIFRSNTSILAQKKKNLRKKESKKKRRNSESTDNERGNHDSGIDLNEEGTQAKGKDMIFEIDI